MIGVYGGSFDPVHEGHLGTASEASELAGCDRVLMIPAALSPGKLAPRASAQQRMEMLQLAVADWPGLQADPCELEREGLSYTVETLRLLRQREADSLVLILGSDAFLGLEQWYCWQELFELAHILVAGRPGVACQPQGALAEEYARRRVVDPGRMQTCDAGLVYEARLTQYPISSTVIRQQLRNHDSPSGLPRAVADYISALNLYLD